jgi:hypothetical protein
MRIPFNIYGCGSIFWVARDDISSCDGLTSFEVILGYIKEDAIFWL